MSALASDPVDAIIQKRKGVPPPKKEAKKSPSKKRKNKGHAVYITTHLSLSPSPLGPTVPLGLRPGRPCIGFGTVGRGFGRRPCPWYALLAGLMGALWFAGWP